MGTPKQTNQNKTQQTWVTCFWHTAHPRPHPHLPLDFRQSLGAREPDMVGDPELRQPPQSKGTTHLPVEALLGVMFGALQMTHLRTDRREVKSMVLCKEDVTPLLTHWSYVFLTLTHRKLHLERCNATSNESNFHVQIIVIRWNIGGNESCATRPPSKRHYNETILEVTK